jgi:branched-subunit amino acid transport protein
MSWAVVIGLSVGAYLLKALGLVVIGDRKFPPRYEGVIALVPAAVLCALIMKDTFTNGQELVIDARMAGVSLAVVGVWCRVPLWLVIVASCAATALVRAVS